MPSKKQATTVWVVMHYEFTRLWGKLLVDALQFHVSSTRSRAEKYIRECSVFPYSWWQIHPHTLDDEDWWHEGEEIYFYSYRGKPLRAATFTQARRAYEREEKKEAKKERKKP